MNRDCPSDSVSARVAVQQVRRSQEGRGADVSGCGENVLVVEDSSAHA